MKLPFTKASFPGFVFSLLFTGSLIAQNFVNPLPIPYRIDADTI